MKSVEEQATRKTYHRPEVKDYGNIRKLTGTLTDKGTRNDGGTGRLHRT